ncbi:hypothetical protein [Mesorhizobium sp. CAU 1732]|uniref:hypothetical protein n=1 Tax=Mesorhizobium sp. CAU 1732 TaxID=3140358 RepID=UPI003260F9DC
MRDHDKARPVSGEIMTDPQARRDNAQPTDFSEAEYETLDPRSALQPAQQSTATPPAVGMDTLRFAAAAEIDDGRQGGPLFWGFSLTLVALAFWVSGGHALMRQAVIGVPSQMAQPLRIAEVKSRIELQGGREILFVEGQAQNHSDQELPLPPIEISVIATDGETTRYFLGTRGTELKPGGRYAFSSRLEPPTNGVKTVAVNFQEDIR